MSQLVRLAFLNPLVVTRSLDGDMTADIAPSGVARGLDLSML